MTAFDRFEQRLPALLDDLAFAQTPDYTDDLLARTAATRQRPGWTFPERWLPMSTITQRFAAAPRVPLRLAVAVALLLVAAIAGALIAGSFATHRPAPFGPATNGQIVYLDEAGQILSGDPVTGQSALVINGTGNRRITFSRDGSRLAFLRTAPGGTFDLVVADADGSHVKTVSPTPIFAPSFMAWAPRGDRIAMIDSTGKLLLFDVSGGAEPIDLSRKLGVSTISIGSGNNDQTTHVFRPPNGDELLFVTNGTGARLQTAHLDGTGLRTLLDPASLGLGSSLMGAQWSPDGSQVVVMVSANNDGSPYHLYLVDADGGNVRPLSSLSSVPLADQGHPMWSPNGTQIAFQHWLREVGEGEGFYPIGVVDVATGQLRDIGPTLINGATWAWSPDGLSILELPAAPSGDGHFLIVNVATGRTNQSPWIASDMNWQRTAPH
jgi:dipeptidyl aminopeptidase/acylaminoacyl peptidase